jgi:hypothetical protein
MTEFLQKQTRFFKNHVILLTIFIVAFFFLLLYSFKFSGNIYGFFRIGSVLPFSPYLDTQKAFIFQGELGFDGQQFLSIAFDPFLYNPATLETLDSPRLRYRRILYPLLGYLLGLGNPQLIPYILVGINFLAIILLVGIVCQYLKQNNCKTWQSLFILCIPGLWIVFSLSTADLLNSLLAIAAIYCYQNQQRAYSALAIAAACLTKEISFVMDFALILTSVRERNWKQIPHLIVAFIPAGLWNIYVLFRLKSQGFLGINENFGYPFLGLGQKFFSVWTGGLNPKNLFELYSFLLLLAIFVANISISTQFKKNNRIIYWSTVLFAALFISSSSSILSYFLNYPRQYMDVYLLLLLSQGEKFERLKQVLMAGAGLSSAIFLLAHT